jgi:TonB family protein
VASTGNGEATGGKKQGGEQAGTPGAEGKTPPSPPKKKVDLKSIGILGMISSRESSKSSSSPSPAIDSQLSLLARNAVSGGETLVRHMENADPPVKASTTGEERNDELFTGDGKAGKTGSKKGGGSGKGSGGKEGEGDGKEEEKVLASAKKIDDLVAKHQQTDTVQLSSRGDLALQKIADVKISGPKNQARTPDAIFEVVSSYKSSIVHCYNKALKRYPDLEGRFVVEFTITAQGDVSKADVVSSTLAKTDSGLEECVISMIRSWHFIPIPIGTTTVVVYPFVFFPAM